jgi:hypothetical protein
MRFGVVVLTVTACADLPPHLTFHGCGDGVLDDGEVCDGETGLDVGTNLSCRSCVELGCTADSVCPGGAPCIYPGVCGAVRHFAMRWSGPMPFADDLVVGRMVPTNNLPLPAPDESASGLIARTGNTLRYRRWDGGQFLDIVERSLPVAATGPVVMADFDRNGLTGLAITTAAGIEVYSSTANGYVSIGSLPQTDNVVAMTETSPHKDVSRTILVATATGKLRKYEPAADKTYSAYTEVPFVVPRHIASDNFGRIVVDADDTTVAAYDASAQPLYSISLHARSIVRTRNRIYVGSDEGVYELGAASKQWSTTAPTSTVARIAMFFSDLAFATGTTIHLANGFAPITAPFAPKIVLGFGSAGFIIADGSDAAYYTEEP